MTVDFESTNLGSIPSKTYPNIAQLVERSTVEVSNVSAHISSGHRFKSDCSEFNTSGVVVTWTPSKGPPRIRFPARVSSYVFHIKTHETTTTTTKSITKP
jgi:hypothetical protein